MRRKIVKKNATNPLLQLLVICCSVLALGGCNKYASTIIPYTGSAPPEELCTLHIAGTLTIKKFDDEKVNWRRKGLDNWVTVQIPEGNHTFVADYFQTTQSGGMYRQDDMAITGSFVAGRNYRMYNSLPSRNLQIRVHIVEAAR